MSRTAGRSRQKFGMRSRDIHGLVRETFLGIIGHSSVHGVIPRRPRLMVYHWVTFGVRLIVPTDVHTLTGSIFWNSPRCTTVLLYFFPADIVVGLGVKVDKISRQSGIATQSCCRASVRLETLGVLEQQFIPSLAVDEFEKIMEFFGIRLAPEGDMQVQKADDSLTAERQIPESILVESLNNAVSRSADSSLGSQDGLQPQTGIVRQCGAEVHEHG